MNTMSNATTIDAPAGSPFLVVTREFDAPRALVFRAAVDPDLVMQWLGPRDLEAVIEHWDARSGGGYGYVHRRAGFAARFRGTFHTVRPDETIIQTFEFDGAPDEVCLEISTYAELADDRTALTMRSIFPSVEARDGALQTGMNDGIRTSMDRLAELLASQG
jgi:uncharacterized protein YndB with AHSA1/START domain